MRISRLRALSCVLPAIVAACPVYAQDNTQAGDGTVASSDDIVVTARRREESLALVPVSISAYGAEDLEKRAIRSEADLQLATPGVTVRQNLSQNQLNFSIRGQSVDAFSNSSPGVLPYINEVQVSASTATSFFDLQGIQILKGPQGTLFGRNATGGAVLYQTQKPTDEFEGFVSARVGNLGQAGLQGAVNIPLSSDRVMLRVAGDYNRSDGNVYNAYRDTRTGGSDARSLRVSLTVKPFEGLTNEFVGQYGWFGGTNSDPFLYSANACGLTNNGYTPSSSAGCLYDPSFPSFAAFLAAHPGVYPDGVKALEAYVRTLGKFTSYNDYPARHRARAGFISNATTLDLGSDLQLKNIVGFTRSRANEQSDLDGTPYPIFAALNSPADSIGQTYRTRQFSNELQLQGTVADGSLDFIIGGYYSFQKDQQDHPLLAFDLSPEIPGTPVTYGWSTVDRSRALFGQATYRFGNGLSVTGGLRYTWETFSIAQTPGTIYASAPSERIKFSKPSWSVGLDYQVSPDLMLYAVTRGSWRTGGFNGFSPPVFATAAGGGNLFLPEKVKDVEVGAKFAGRVGDTPLRMNLALYNQWIDDIQRTAYYILNGNPLSFTANVPKAKVTGVEADINVKPASWLELGGSIAYANARFTSPRVSFFGTSVDFGPYADAPKWTGTLFAQATAPLPGDAGSLGLRAELYAQTGQYFSNLNDTINPDTRLPGYALGNVRLDWEEPFSAPVTVSAFVKNVGNRGYWVGGVPEGANLGVNIASWGQPRTYGLEMRYRF
ncbi:TonB-dependent receptor [Sphingopyxis sp. YF1]|uniref:TonB-dependent receptor n=1 Tax=Sphingopyxis sp. YF1 TaxID=2482763 RepID=UPI001F61F674|nr:TonB-dependent receptor [Sphingopyxis sp. YF1]UNU43723.1 TonB-dependent receptor [Sphingopyxis sp. YF1]